MPFRRPGSPRRRMVALALLAVTVGAPVAIRAAPAHAQSDASSPTATIGRYVADAAGQFALPEAWIWAVMRAESNGDVRAVSPAGAMGLMQIMPATWTTLRARYRLGSDPFDPRANIMTGAAYLREMHDRYGNATAMLAAYNAGPGRYDEYLARGRPLPAETRAYLAKLTAITGGSGDAQMAVAPAPDPLAWRRAALFTVRSGVTATAPPDTASDDAAAQTARRSTDRTGVTVAATTPPSTGLFIPLSGSPAP